MIRSLLTIYLAFSASPTALRNVNFMVMRDVKRVRLEGAISDSAEKVSDIENTENVEQEQGTMGVEYEQI